MEREGPQRDALERRGVRPEICIDQHQTAKQRLRFRRRHADTYTRLFRGRIGEPTPIASAPATRVT